MSICCVHPQSSLPAIDVVQNVYSDLGLTQTLDRSGSEWTRSVSNSNIVQQSYSDNYGVSASSTLALVSTASYDALLLASASSALSFVQVVTVAGGRVTSGGGGGESSQFEIVYDSGGASAAQGLFVYVDSADNEAKLASFDGENEVAGMLVAAVTAGDTATVQTEGNITLADWTDVAGTATLTAGATYYLGSDGLMTVTPPVTGAVVSLGRALKPLEFDLEINLPWVL